MDKKNSLKTGEKAVSIFRYIAFSLIIAGSIFVIWRDIYAWHICIKEVQGPGSKLLPLYPVLLACVVSIMSAFFLLGNKTDTGKKRIIAEIIYTILVLYMLWEIIDVIHYFLWFVQPGHSGPMEF